MLNTSDSLHIETALPNLWCFAVTSTLASGVEWLIFFGSEALHAGTLCACESGWHVIIFSGAANQILQHEKMKLALHPAGCSHSLTV